LPVLLFIVWQSITKQALNKAGMIMTIDQVRDFILSHQLIQSGEHVLAACSGGPDSLALVDILRKLRLEFGYQLAVAHVDHMFRGEASAADAQFVRDYCQRHGLTCFSTAINVPQYLLEQGGSSQNTSRKLRYEYLREAAQTWGNAKIATGHHQDDQAETILLHLLRGSGGAGLSGIHAQADGIVRPLLSLTRQEIEDYCRQYGLEPRQDSSNLKPNYLRNKIRLQIIPQLELAVGGSVREPLCRAGKILADEQDFLNDSVQAVWPDLTRETPDATYLYTEPLSKLHIALKRLIFRLLIEKKQGNLTGITFQHVEKLIEMADSWPVGSKFDLPGGWRAEREYDAIQVRRRATGSVWRGIAPPGVQLLIPGETEVRGLGVRVRVTVQSCLPQHDAPDTAVFDLAGLQQPLFVRSRQPGDRFSPCGMQGEKKLKDFFIDKKVPRSLRDQVPVFSDSRGIIFWLGGLRGSRQGRITAATTEYLVLQIIGIQEALS
jgi:tRNA(Ile)-lysidine synthase